MRTGFDRPSSWSCIKCGIDFGRDPAGSQLLTELLNSLKFGNAAFRKTCTHVELIPLESRRAKMKPGAREKAIFALVMVFVIGLLILTYGATGLKEVRNGNRNN